MYGSLNICIDPPSEDNEGVWEATLDDGDNGQPYYEAASFEKLLVKISEDKHALSVAQWLADSVEV